MEGGPADPVPGERVLVPGGGAGGASGVGGRLLLRKPLLAQPGLAHHPDAGGDDAPVLMGYEVSNVSAFWEVRLECLARARVVRFMYSSDYYTILASCSNSYYYESVVLMHTTRVAPMHTLE